MKTKLLFFALLLTTTTTLFAQNGLLPFYPHGQHGFPEKMDCETMARFFETPPTDPVWAAQVNLSVAYQLSFWNKINQENNGWLFHDPSGNIKAINPNNLSQIYRDGCQKGIIKIVPSTKKRNYYALKPEGDSIKVVLFPRDPYPGEEIFQVYVQGKIYDGVSTSCGNVAEDMLMTQSAPQASSNGNNNGQFKYSVDVPKPTNGSGVQLTVYVDASGNGSNNTTTVNPGTNGVVTSNCGQCSQVSMTQPVSMCMHGLSSQSCQSCTQMRATWQATTTSTQGLACQTCGVNQSNGAWTRDDVAFVEESLQTNNRLTAQSNQIAMKDLQYSKRTANATTATAVGVWVAPFISYGLSKIPAFGNGNGTAFQPYMPMNQAPNFTPVTPGSFGQAAGFSTHE